jgi:hypothetical protein
VESNHRRKKKMADKPVKIAYLADDIPNLATLQLSCERDEGDLTATLSKLEMIKVDKPAGKVAILASYRLFPDEELPTNVKFGELVFVMPVAGQTLDQLKQQQAALNRDFLFSSDLVIADTKLNVVAFRPKPDPA